jgi:hypothetical protein
LTVASAPIGGILNIPFLTPNANVISISATFWIETVVVPESESSFLQLQYSQTVIFEFPSGQTRWPHISVATLRKR